MTIMTDGCDKIMILTGESVAQLLCAGTKGDAWPHEPHDVPLVTASSSSPEVIADMRAHLPDVADRTVAAIIEEVPSYQDALSGSMGEIIRNAVQLALGGFLSLAGGRRGADPGTPTAPAMEGAYQLGRGEARNGRSTDALLSAYRIGAGWPGARCRRAPWRPASRPTGSRASRSWCSPTSTSCRPRAWPGTPTSWPRPAGCASGSSNGWPPTCSTGRRPSTCRRRPTGPSGRRRAR